MKNNEVVSQEVALDDLEKFVNTYVKKPVKREELEETYPDVLEAIVGGFLSFDENQVPKLKLKNPIPSMDDPNIISVSELSFKTRIKPTDMRKIAFGIDFKKDPIGFQHKAIAHITSQAELTIDKYSRYDCDVIQQICSVFM